MGAGQGWKSCERGRLQKTPLCPRPLRRTKNKKKNFLVTYYSGFPVRAAFGSTKITLFSKPIGKKTNPPFIKERVVNLPTVVFECCEGMTWLPLQPNKAQSFFKVGSPCKCLICSF